MTLGRLNRREKHEHCLDHVIQEGETSFKSSSFPNLSRPNLVGYPSRNIMRVLVVEDSTPILRAVVGSLEESGFAVDSMRIETLTSASMNLLPSLKASAHPWSVARARAREKARKGVIAKKRQSWRS
jgi:hypothetical protein